MGSEYIVYELPNCNTEGACKKHKVIKSTEKEDVGFVVCSLCGYDHEGTVLFEYYDFEGPEAYMYTESCSDIRNKFPCIARGEGISSIMVLAVK